MELIAVEDAVRLRRAINRLARKFNAAATDEGLTPSQASVLGLIVAHGGLGISDLVDLEHINPTMLSRVVGKLEEAGLIERAQNPDDLRSVMLEATPDGRRVQQRITTQRADLVARGVAELAPGQRSALLHALPALEALADAVP